VNLNTKLDLSAPVNFKGEWVATPREDFDALRAALARLDGAT